METSDIKTYFEKYLKQYTPYKDSTLYQALNDYFLENFTGELYTTIPKILKELYEDNVIDHTIYDYLLEGIGVPKNVIRQLSGNDKTIFFNNITDFYRYRGDIDFFSKVTKLFPKIKFDVYELYVDYDDSFGSDDWVFKPYLIVKNTEGEKDIANIRYDEVYNNVPSLLINKTQLSYYKDNSDIILPYKSNILLLDCSYYYEVSSLISLIISTFIKEYKSYVIDIYFEDYATSINIGDFYLLWNYILLKHYNTTSFGGFHIEQIVEYSEYLNPYSIDDIEGIIQKYNKIRNAREAREFYEEYIENYFKVSAKYYELNHEDVRPYINITIINYLENRMSEFSDDLKSIGYNEILNELLNSFLLYVSNSSNPTFRIYSEYFINSLTRITIDPKNTSTYILLSNFKPFHTELITQFYDYIFVDNNFEMILPDSEVKFLYSLERADVHDITEYNRFNMLFQNYSDVQLIEIVYCYLTHIKTENLNLIEELFKEINIKSLDVNNIMDVFVQVLTNYVYTILSLSESNEINILKNKLEDIDISEQLINIIKFLNLEVHNIVDTGYVNILKYIYILSLPSEFTTFNISKNKLEDIDISDNVIITICNMITDFLSNKEQINIKTNNYSVDNNIIGEEFNIF